MENACFLLLFVTVVGSENMLKTYVCFPEEMWNRLAQLVDGKCLHDDMAMATWSTIRQKHRETHESIQDPHRSPPATLKSPVQPPLRPVGRCLKSMEHHGTKSFQQTKQSKWSFHSQRNSHQDDDLVWHLKTLHQNNCCLANTYSKSVFVIMGSTHVKTMVIWPFCR